MQTDIRHERDNPVADHFLGAGHTIENVGVTVLEAIRDSSKYYRQVRELDWIVKLQAEVPNGINKKAEVGVGCCGMSINKIELEQRCTLGQYWIAYYNPKNINEAIMNVLILCNTVNSETFACSKFSHLFA